MSSTSLTLFLLAAAFSHVLQGARIKRSLTEEEPDDQLGTETAATNPGDKDFGNDPDRWLKELQTKCAKWGTNATVSKKKEQFEDGFCACGDESELTGPIYTVRSEYGIRTGPRCYDHGRRNFWPDENMNPIENCSCTWQPLECSLYMDSQAEWSPDMVETYCWVRWGARNMNDAWTCTNDTAGNYSKGGNLSDYLMYLAPDSDSWPTCGNKDKYPDGAPTCDEKKIPPPPPITTLGVMDRCWPQSDPNRSADGDRGRILSSVIVTLDKGAHCLKNWEYKVNDEYLRTNEYCFNPDSDPKGPWCKVTEDMEAKQGKNWGYCTPAPEPV